LRLLSGAPYKSDKVDITSGSPDGRQSGICQS
jgi:hypothetical protein